MISDNVMVKDVVDLIAQLRVLALKMERVNDFNKNLDHALEELHKFHTAHNAEEIKEEIWSNVNLAISSMQVDLSTKNIESKIEQLISDKYSKLIDDIKIDELDKLPDRLNEFEKNIGEHLIATNTIITNTSIIMRKHNDDLNILVKETGENSKRLLEANKTITSYKIWHLFSISMSFFFLGFLSSQYFQNNPITVTVEKEVEVPSRLNQYVSLHEGKDGIFIVSKKKQKSKNVYLSDTKNAVIKVK